MRTFRDNAGRTWTVAIDLDAVQRVRETLKVNLVSTEFAEVLEQLLSDPVLLGDVLYVVCKPEADKANVAKVDLFRALAGDAIDQATTALLEALADFTPNPRDRARVQRVLRAMFGLAERHRDVAEKRLDEVLEKALATTSGPSSGGSPASSASTPAP